ncbi:MAG: InlB B-repeat-containing protein, partial [Candidatus Bathyarchaeota archaeon]|nr:InlB B-repeat-containing protein [Candidatus Termiticorpusculum sp.]
APVDGNSPYYQGYFATVLGQGSLLKSNYTFLGWSTNSSATTAEFTQGQTFAISKDTLLYAVWEEYPKYSVTYDGNGATAGSVPVDNGLYYQGNTVTVQANPGELAREDDGSVPRLLPGVVTYVFKGWAYLSNAAVPDFTVSGSSVSPSTFTMGNANVTLYAVWEEIIRYSVVYVDNGATSGAAPVDSSSPYEPGTTVTVLGQGTMLRDDHIFLGYSTNQLAVSPQYLAGQKFTITQDVTLYAVWRRDDIPPPPMFHVYYDSNAPSGVVVTGTVPQDEGLYLEEQTVTVMANPGNLACATFRFLGWAKVSNASEPAFVVSGNTVSPGWFVMGALDVTLFAVWQAVPLFSVVYQPNGATSGSVPVDGETYVDGASVTVLGQGSLLRANYSFLGWNVNSSSTTALYLPGATFTITGSSVVLFAIWREDTKYSVTYHGNGASGGSAPVDVNSPYYAGSNVGVLNQGALVRDGYKFLGWATVSSASTAQYTAGDVFTIGAANVVLYAVWQLIPVTYTVEYRANWPNNETGLGSPPLDVTEYVVGATVTVQANPNNLTLSGYRLRGWSSNQYATAPSFVISGNSVVPSTFIMGSINVVLYAIWEKIQYHQVVYRDNGAEDGAAPVDFGLYETGDTVTVRANTGNLARHGYAFIGWATTGAATVPDYVVSNNGYVQPSTFVMPSSTVYLYPVWQQIARYTVTYHPNNADSGEVPENQNQFIQNSIVSVRPNIKNLSRVGYIFTGWATTKLAPAPDYTVDGNNVTPNSFIITQNIDLYAVWLARTIYKVTYNANWPNNTIGTGEPPIDNTTYYYEDQVTIQANPKQLSKDGYTFTGWIYNNQMHHINANTVNPQTVTITENIIFYAVWRLDEPPKYVHYGTLENAKILIRATYAEQFNPQRDELITPVLSKCLVMATDWINGSLQSQNLTLPEKTPDGIAHICELYAAGLYLQRSIPEGNTKIHEFRESAKTMLEKWVETAKENGAVEETIKPPPIAVGKFHN